MPWLIRMASPCSIRLIMMMLVYVLLSGTLAISYTPSSYPLLDLHCGALITSRALVGYAINSMV